MKKSYALAISFVAIALSACAHSRISRYQGMLDPLLGNGKRAQVDKLLGSPTSCKEADGLQSCEYRTAASRNDPVPDASRKSAGFGPDLSPYDYFDVIAAHYDGFGILKDWEPIVIKP